MKNTKQKKEKGNKKKQSLSFKSKLRYWGKKAWRGVLFLGMALISWAILSIGSQQQQVFWMEGDIADDDFFYQGATTTYTSNILTDEAKTKAAAAVEEQYIIDEAVVANLDTVITGYFDLILQASEGDISISTLKSSLPGSYTNDVLYSIINMSRDDIVALRDSFLRIVESTFEAGVMEEEVEDARNSIALAIGVSTISGNQELFLKGLNESLDYSYNKVFDTLTTAQKIQEAQASVEPVQVTVRQGERLVSRGQIVTAQQVEALQALGLQSENKVLTPTIGLLILVLVCYLILYFYLKFYQQEFFDRQSAILLLGVVMIVILFICKLISLISFNADSALSLQIGYLLPVAAASMVLAVLLNKEIAVLSTVLLAIFAGISMDGELAYALVALSGGITGVITATRLDQRSQFVSASAYIILANLLTIGSWGLITHQSYSVIGIGMVFGLVNGLLSAILAMGILPYLENAFGITTVIKLLELSNSNHPLLKRLMMEAPGTYNHSILVGNLAEAAATAIGANTLLVRVASYYHDIGKLKRPYFYIENQRPGDNPHDKLQPGLSAMIITSHTTDGARMLREAHFPEEIIDIVEQHHGNSLLTFFYNKAKEQAMDPDDIRISDYCYKGRKPQTKEAALVMLADSVQAAVQSLTSQDKNAVAEKVQSVIDSKLKNGQLSDCPLTFKDLGIISQSFLMVLSGMNHQRISYPDNGNILPEGMMNKAIMQEISDGGNKNDR